MSLCKSMTGRQVGDLVYGIFGLFPLMLVAPVIVPHTSPPTVRSEMSLDNVKCAPRGKITPSWESLMQCFVKDREATFIVCLSYNAMNYKLLNCENSVFTFKEVMMQLELQNVLALPSKEKFIESKLHI